MAKRSERLNAAINLVTYGHRVADIGTDHGFLPIELVQRGISPSAIAMDVRIGPLDRAKEHIAQAGLKDRIETRLSDGLEQLFPKEADTVVIMGMGGGLITRILTEGERSLEGVSELILGPQSEQEKVRRYLEQSDFGIAEEIMLCEEGKYYMLIRAVRGNAQPALTEAEAIYGPKLLTEKNATLKEYLDHQEAVLSGIEKGLLARLDHLQDETSASLEGRLEELEQELLHLREAQSYF